MIKRRRRRNSINLVALAAAAVAYALLLRAVPPPHAFSGRPWLDGAVGVLLGLYICSRPTANLLDLLLFSDQRGFSLRAELAWLGLNFLVLSAGCAIVMAGATRFTVAGGL